MMIQETLKKLDTDEAGKLMETLYGAAQAEENKARYRQTGTCCYSAPRDGQRSAETIRITTTARCWREALT